MQDCDERTLSYSKWKEQQDQHMERQKKKEAYNLSNLPWAKCVLTERYMCRKQREAKRRLDETVAISAAESAKRRQSALQDTEKELYRRYRVFPMFGESV